MPQMTLRADIAVCDAENRLQLVVEVKSKVGASPEWAAQLRHNLLAFSVISQVPYFLLALPDFFYFWKNDGPADGNAPPDCIIAAADLLAPYLTPPTLSLADMSEYGLELLVATWLSDLVVSDPAALLGQPALSWLFSSGLYAAIRQGSVVTEVAV